MSCFCFENKDTAKDLQFRKRISLLMSENKELKNQLDIQTRALLVAEAKREALEEENKRLSKNVNLSQKVIWEELKEGKRYRRAIRSERKLRKEASKPLPLVKENSKNGVNNRSRLTSSLGSVFMSAK